MAAILPVNHLRRFLSLRQALAKYWSNDPRVQRVKISAANGVARLEAVESMGLTSEIILDESENSLPPIVVDAKSLGQAIKGLAKNEVKIQVKDDHLVISTSQFSTDLESLPLPDEYLRSPEDGKLILEFSPQWMGRFCQIDFARIRSKKEVPARDAISGFLLQWDSKNRVLSTIETDHVMAGLFQEDAITMNIDTEFWNLVERVFFSEAAGEFLNWIASTLPEFNLKLFCRDHSIAHGVFSANFVWQCSIERETFRFYEWYSQLMNTAKDYLGFLKLFLSKMRFWFSVDIRELRAAVERASKFATQDKGIHTIAEKMNVFLTTFSNPNSGLRVSAFGNGNFSETVRLHSGPSDCKVISFDPARLMKILRAFERGIVEFYLSAQSPHRSPVGIIRDVQAIIMPCNFDPTSLPSFITEGVQ